MDLQLEGKVALVTGGSRGIGKAIALGLAQEGVRVAVCARTAEDVRKAVEEISRATGQQLLAVPGDVAKPGDIEEMVDGTAGAFGSLDILVSNAVVTFLASPRSSSLSGEVLAAGGGAGTGIFI